MEPMSKTQARKPRALSPLATPEKRSSTPPESSGEKSQYEYYYDEEDDSPLKSEEKSPEGYVMIDKKDIAKNTTPPEIRVNI